MAKEKNLELAEQIEALQAENAELKAALEQKDEASNQLLAELQEKTDELNLLKDQYEQLMNGAATVQPADKPAVPGVPNDVVSIDGAKYRFTVAKLSIRHIGERTALECLADDEAYPQLGGLTILRWLAANGSSALEAVPE